jgi:hypothetical protein
MGEPRREGFCKDVRETAGAVSANVGKTLRLEL